MCLFRNPSPAVLADLMADVMTLNARILPYYERFAQVLRQDENFADDVSADVTVAECNFQQMFAIYFRTSARDANSATLIWSAKQCTTSVMPTTPSPT